MSKKADANGTGEQLAILDSVSELLVGSYLHVRDTDTVPGSRIGIQDHTQALRLGLLVVRKIHPGFQRIAGNSAITGFRSTISIRRSVQ